jgi:hypothetical protein
MFNESGTGQQYYHQPKRAAMKSILRILVGVAAVVGAFTASTVSAQKLDGLWLKSKFSAKGYLLDDSSGAVSKYGTSATVYLHFTWDGSEYAIDLWTLADGAWSNSYSTSANTIGLGENFLSDFDLSFYFSGGDYMSTFSSPYIAATTNSTGAVTKATYTGTGEVYDAFVGNKEFYGYFSMKGTSVAPATLPFTP